jgi:hypothetical protein
MTVANRKGAETIAVVVTATSLAISITNRSTGKAT